MRHRHLGTPGEEGDDGDGRVLEAAVAGEVPHAPAQVDVGQPRADGEHPAGTGHGAGLTRRRGIQVCMCVQGRMGGGSCNFLCHLVKVWWSGLAPEDNVLQRDTWQGLHGL